MNDFQEMKEAKERIFANVLRKETDAIKLRQLANYFRKDGSTVKADKLEEKAKLCEMELYAIACERRDIDGNWHADIVHLHAMDSSNARYCFLLDSSNRGPNVRIVAVGPVVGYHVEDEHGEKLRA